VAYPSTFPDAVSFDCANEKSICEDTMPEYTSDSGSWLNCVSELILLHPSLDCISSIIVLCRHLYIASDIKKYLSINIVADLELAMMKELS